MDLLLVSLVRSLLKQLLNRLERSIDRIATILGLKRFVVSRRLFACLVTTCAPFSHVTSLGGEILAEMKQTPAAATPTTQLSPPNKINQRNSICQFMPLATSNSTIGVAVVAADYTCDRSSAGVLETLAMRRQTLLSRTDQGSARARA